MSKILIVEDERDICEILEFNLLNEGFEVVCAYSAEEALDTLTADVSLILLDVMMGGISGYKMAEKLRREGNKTPIIFLTAKDTENDMLTGFSVGGDDYISKPFSIKEVVARTKAVLRRLDKPIEIKGEKMLFHDVIIDMETKELSIGKEKIALTKTEFEILSFLAGHPDKLLSREDIIEKVWAQTPFISERTVDVHITRLRKKMGSHGSLIENRSGYGYRFNPENL